MPVQVLEFIPSGTSKNGKRTPPKVKLSSGIDAVIGRNVNFQDVQKGCWGEPNILTEEKNGYTNHTLESWQMTMPAGQATQLMPTHEQKDAAKTDQSVWDAKDRTLACESAYKSASPIVAAMLTSGVVKTEADALRCLDGLALTMYESFMLARQDRIATKANPYASE